MNELPRHAHPTPSRGLAWWAGLGVAIGAAVLTAHGLYEVAVSSGVPGWVAWLYPVITDGLALVAYAATAKLTDAGRGYAWTVVIVAAGLSGLAQATYLAGTVQAASSALRFGVGAWPAIAAAVVAHLLFLLGGRYRSAAGSQAEPTVDPAPTPAALKADPVPAGDRTAVALPAPAHLISRSDQAAAEALVGPGHQPSHGPVQALPGPVRTALDHSAPPATRADRQAAAPPADRPGRSDRSDEELLDTLRQLVEDNGRLSRNQVAKELGVGSGRAGRLIARHDAEQAQSTGPELVTATTATDRHDGDQAA